MFVAHSPKAAEGIPAQSYKDHIDSVTTKALANTALATGNARFAQLLLKAVELAAQYHDLGKLDPLNQSVLFTEGKGRLPLNHVDAGVAEMLRRNDSKSAAVAALLIYSHHRGLPDRTELINNKMRDISLHELFGSTKNRTDNLLQQYLRDHRGEIGPEAEGLREQEFTPSCMQLMFRMGLSCLVDADHFDTARNYGHEQEIVATPLRPTDRLAQLDRYVASLATDENSDRNLLRNAVYRSCREKHLDRGLVSCDSPVGSGKTTAVMAHLLRVAAENNLRRIFVVLPFSNIITQSVDVYRRSIVLCGEEADHVVAAHHHRAEFSDLQSRHLTYLWEAPIVVTTAVQFFETLAAASTSSLRKLHQLARAAVFIDESHAALPSHLWPLAWKWLQLLSQEWNCHFVLGSGSLTKFWTLPEFANPLCSLPSIVDDHPHQESQRYEADRINYACNSHPMSLEELTQWTASFAGPRLLIVNTVQSAAYIAKSLAESQDGHKAVEHLSTSLTPKDREDTLQRVKKRLKDDTDTDWTLVATSCVEAGVDISFRTGFRERASLNSLLQTSGRVNRSGEHGAAEVWDFQLQFDQRLRKHPAFDDSAAVVGELFSEGKVAQQYCTEAMRREVGRAGMNTAASLLSTAESKHQFVDVEERFRVIDTNTNTAVVDATLKKRLVNRQKVTFQELQEGSVQIYCNRRMDFALEPIHERQGVYAWTLNYDSFLGYMAGVIGNVDFVTDGGAFV